MAQTQTLPVQRKDRVLPPQITSDPQGQDGSTEKAETSYTGTEGKHWKKINGRSIQGEKSGEPRHLGREIQPGHMEYQGSILWMDPWQQESDQKGDE